MDLPITGLSILSDKSRCPPRYTMITNSFDGNVEIELWSNSLFGKKTNRYICFTKELNNNNVSITS